MTMENVAPGFRGHHSFIATALFQMIKRRPVHALITHTIVVRVVYNH